MEVISDGQATELKGWSVYNLPPFYEFVSNTFLDMQTWGKGMVWVNGHAMGRFWEIGPQQTLYMPGCWLKEGENEIIILDLKGPAETKVIGLEKPILDMLRTQAPETHRKDGQALKLNAEKPAHKGTAGRK